MLGTKSSTPPHPEVTKNELVELLNLLTLLKPLELLHVHNAALQGHHHIQLVETYVHASYVVNVVNVVNVQLQLNTTRSLTDTKK